MPKLLDKTIENTDDPIIQWIQFINSKSEGVLKMLTEKNKDIKEAYDYLKIISQDEKARMEYEAREAELHDQMTRMKSALERGKKENSIKIVKNMLRMEIDTEKIAEATEMTIDEILRIKDKLE
jgi:predicted transposase/invertase (TIGR01784 family)